MTSLADKRVAIKICVGHAVIDATGKLLGRVYKKEAQAKARLTLSRGRASHVLPVFVEVTL